MPRKPGKKDFDLERMYQKLVPSMQGDELDALIYTPEPLTIPIEQEGDETEFRPVNLMRYILMEKMEHTMKMLRCCCCERCQSDVLALALNQLNPSYAVDKERFEDKVSELRRVHEVKLTSALIMAVQTVKANPRH
jgi:competence protein ComFB